MRCRHVHVHPATRALARATRSGWCVQHGFNPFQTSAVGMRSRLGAGWPRIASSVSLELCIYLSTEPTIVRQVCGSNMAGKVSHGNGGEARVSFQQKFRVSPVVSRVFVYGETLRALQRRRRCGGGLLPPAVARAVR